MTSAPLFFDVVTQRREDQDGKNVLQTIVGMAGLPIMHRVVEIEDVEDEAAISVLSIQERQQASHDFAFVIRGLLEAVEAANRQSVANNNEENSTDA